MHPREFLDSRPEILQLVTITKHGIGGQNAEFRGHVVLPAQRFTPLQQVMKELKRYLLEQCNVQ